MADEAKNAAVRKSFMVNLVLSEGKCKRSKRAVDRGRLLFPCLEPLGGWVYWWLFDNKDQTKVKQSHDDVCVRGFCCEAHGYNLSSPALEHENRYRWFMVIMVWG